MDSNILLIYKPEGITSRKAMLLATHEHKKAGLEGILDIFASGLLIAGTNNATRFLRYFLELRKVYEASLKLGVETDTLDLSGTVLRSEKPPRPTEQQIKTILKKFKGRLPQTPPKYSNIKVHGIPARKLARKKIDIELRSREVTIYDIGLIDFCDDIIRFKTSVKSGTYIRSLGADIAKELGTIGHLQSLKRISIGKFSINDVFSGEDIRINHKNNSRIYVQKISVSEALYWMPEISLDYEMIQKLSHGQILQVEKKSDEDNVYKIIDGDDRFFGLALLQDDQLIPKKMMPDL